MGEVVVVAGAAAAAAVAVVKAKADSRGGQQSAAVAGCRAVGGCCLWRRRRRKGEGQSDLPWLRLKLVVVSVGQSVVAWAVLAVGTGPTITCIHKAPSTLGPGRSMANKVILDALNLLERGHFTSALVLILVNRFNLEY